MLSSLQGAEAVKAVLEATPDTPSPVICIVENKIVRRPLLEAVKQTHEVAKAIEAKDFNRAMSLRDAEFAEYYQAYNITTSSDQPHMLLPENQVLNPLDTVVIHPHEFHMLTNFSDGESVSFTSAHLLEV
jgi:6-phosphofructokinase 1